MEKGIKSSNSIFRREIDSLSSARLNLLEKNAHLQELLSKKEPRGASHNEVDTLSPPMNNSSCTAPSSQPSALNPSSQIISVGGAEVVPLPATVPIITSSLMSPILIYSILTLLLIAIIWLVVRKCWSSWKKSNTDYSPNQNYFLSSSGISEARLYSSYNEEKNISNYKILLNRNQSYEFPIRHAKEPKDRTTSYETLSFRYG